MKIDINQRVGPGQPELDRLFECMIKFSMFVRHPDQQ